MHPHPPYQPSSMPQPGPSSGPPMGGPAWGTTPQPWRLGPFLAFVGAVLIGIGAIVLAFTLGSITVTAPLVSGTTITIGVQSAAFLFGLPLVGVGIIVRAFGVLLTKPS